MYVIVRKKQLILYLLYVLAGVAALALAIFMAQKAAASARSLNAPVVYLTFDDGPSRNTADVLDVLKEQEVRGTFFVIGCTEGYESALYRRIVEENHAIGIHSYSHNAAEIYASLPAFQADFTRIDDLIYTQTGQRTKVCRLPGGTSTSLCPPYLRKRILEYFGKTGYACFDWDIDPKDSGAYALPAAKLSASVIAQAKKRPGEDLVVLMHDDGLRKTLANALPGIIGYFKDKGYVFGVLREDLQLVSRRG